MWVGNKPCFFQDAEFRKLRFAKLLIKFCGRNQWGLERNTVLFCKGQDDCAGG